MSKKKTPMTKEEEMFRAYRAKLKREAIFKSLIPALAVGFLLGAIVSVISFATAYDLLWVALLVWGVATVGLTVLFYYMLYCPNMKTTAKRVDEIGLEERAITMVQFKDEGGAMFDRQRRDTKEALQTVSAKQMKPHISRLLLLVLAVAAAISIFMMSYSTVLAGRASEIEDEPIAEEEQVGDDDRIIRDMIESLRDEIDRAEIDETLRGYLHGLVNDLEASLRPEDPLEIKIAKVMDTADKIHKLIQDYLNRSTIPKELQKYDTTRELGEALETEDLGKIEEAFQMMYDRIAPLAGEQKYDELSQTATDILRSIEDAEVKDEALAEVLTELAQAYLDAIPKQPPQGGEEDRVNDEINQEIQDAMDKAMDGIKDALEQKDQNQQQQDQNAEDLDQKLQDVIQDAMEQLGQEFEYPEDPKEDEKDQEDKEDQESQKPEQDENESGGSSTPDDGNMRDTVIDGQTSYKDVFDDGYAEELRKKLESGDLTDEEREIIQDYLDTLD